MFEVLLSAAGPAGGESGSGGLMDVFQKNPTFLSINLVVSRAGFVVAPPGGVADLFALVDFADSVALSSLPKVRSSFCSKPQARASFTERTVRGSAQRSPTPVPGPSAHDVTRSDRGAANVFGHRADAE